jgi:hypothetical protein
MMGSTASGHWENYHMEHYHMCIEHFFNHFRKMVNFFETFATWIKISAA